MSAILSVDQEVEFDDSVDSFEYHTHLPYASTTFNLNDEIRIPIFQQDIYTLPSKSYLLIEGTLSGKKDGKEVQDDSLKFVSNGPAYLFDEMKYTINGVEVDRIKNVGITTSLKNLWSIRKSEVWALEYAGWSANGSDNLTKSGTHFCFYIPLRLWSGFFEDYRKILLNVKQELVLLRASTNVNALLLPPGKSHNEWELKINKIAWRMPYIGVTDVQRLPLLKMVERDEYVSIPYRKMELFEYPVLPTTSQQTWTIKSSTQLETPRYVILAFQTGRKNVDTKHANKFDRCNIRNVKVYLNSQYYPYDNFNGNEALFWNAFLEIQKNYYNRGYCEPFIKPTQFFADFPMVVIDCSKQKDTLKSGIVDIRVDFESSENFPASTSAYCLILHDAVIGYKPLSGLVNTNVAF